MNYIFRYGQPGKLLDFLLLLLTQLGNLSGGHAAAEVEEIIGLDCSDAPKISAKTGQRVKSVMDLVEKVYDQSTKRAGFAAM